MIASYLTLPPNNAGLIQASPTGLSASANAGDKSIGMWVSSASSRIWGRGIQSNTTQRNISMVTALTASTTYIFNNVYRTNRIDHYVNNVASGNNTAHNGTLNSWTDIAIGKQSNESWNGNIAEVIFYATEVNSAQRIIIDNYLSAKYGLSLGANDLYTQDNVGNGNFDFEVAGIGRLDASNSHNDAKGSGIVRILNPTELGDNEFLIWGHNNGILQAEELTDVPSGVAARSARTWRVSEVDNTGAAIDVGAIDIRFDLNGLGSLTASDDDDNGVFANDAALSGAVNLGGGIYEFQNVPGGAGVIRNNRRFTIGTINTTQTPLPIVLLTFEAKSIDNHSIELQWQTTSEKFNNVFIIERSSNGIDWEQLAIVPGAGNSSTLLSYANMDNDPLSGTSYYRLKQVDIDGSYSYSSSITATITKRPQQVLLFPNPTLNILTIVGPNQALESIKISTMIGKDITNQIIFLERTDEKVVIDLSNLSSGSYSINTSTTSHLVNKQ